MLRLDSPKVFILCAGYQSRWNGPGLKQLVPIKGKPLLMRTIDHFDRESIHVVTNNQHLKDWCDIRSIKTLRPRCSVTVIDTFKSLEKYLGSENIFLLGDVLYTDTALNTIQNGSARILYNGNDVFALKLKFDHFRESFKDVANFNEFRLYNRKLPSRWIDDGTRDFDCYQHYLDSKGDNNEII